MAERSRREHKLKTDKFAEYRRAREGGARTWKDDADVAIYDEVSEDRYKSIVKGRLQQDDFVVDDGATGYMDDGHDDWIGGGDSAPGSDDDDSKRRNKSKKKENSRSRPKAPPPPAVAPTISAYRPKVTEEQEKDFLSSLFGAMDQGATAPKPRKRKPSPQYRDNRSSSPIFEDSMHLNLHNDASSDGPLDDSSGPPPSSSPGHLMSPRKKVRMGSMDPEIEKMSRLDVHSADELDASFDMSSFDDIDMEAFMDVDGADIGEPAKNEDQKKKHFYKVNDLQTEVPDKTEPNISSWLSVYDSLPIQHEDALGPLSDSSSVPLKSSDKSALEPDGSFHFFWLDYLEHDSKLYFTGKLKDKVSGGWISCCVTVEGLQRNLFVLPRERRVEQDEDGGLCETDIIPESSDVYADFDAVRSRFGIKKWKGKFIKRKYAFGERDVPKEERQWLKVVYGFDEPQIPPNVQSPNFSRIFGTNTSAFELLVLKRKIMGPCWLQVKKPFIDNKGISWCKLEVTVKDPKDINPFPETDVNFPKEMPPLTIMSLSVRSIMNHVENKREIVCVSSRTWNNFQLDDSTPVEKLPCSVQTFVRPLDRFPPDFELKARASSRGTVSPATSERGLLGGFLSMYHRADPDVIVGHEFLGVSLDVLLYRMRELKVDHWSRISRFRRSKWPSIGKQGTNLRFLNGRLVCDLASDAAKGMISSTTWSLTEMCKTYLKSERQEIDPNETASYFDGSVSSPDRLLTFVRHCDLDTHYHMALVAKVEILPLTRQLTNLAGNSWNKTLNGGRAERNEYILLHEFHRLKYICPDKFFGKRPKFEVDDDDQEAGKAKSKSKRDKYKGGLVFEPKRGLWDKYVLVMDFNSLYPSIIQEYNIDFTTVERSDDEDGEDKIPEPPSPDVPQGVLPRLIATLVNRRRQVKALMKDKSISHSKLLQYNIKQMALKLTANSMYGCLGFENSRFYARPLAALTTFKGREILTHTRELAESLQLDVIYGDTDSVFVNSNVTDFAEALKISAEFKKTVNNCYRLLEIDLDSVFQRLLLLQKKKYAAIKVEDGTLTSTEVKGLDMKRREYCALSKNVSQYVLEQILSGEATEVVVERIHEYLVMIGGEIRGGKIKQDEFIIFKQLGKNPEHYPDAKSQPHVQVALRMKARGGTARAGDVIPYIFCLGEGDDMARTGQAERAKHPDEVRKADSGLRIDFEYYLSHQVLPPIERLCDPIEGTDRARLAECLGLDPSRYRNSSSAESEERYFSTLDSRMSDSQLYRDAKPFIVHCRRCEAQFAFTPIHEQDTCMLRPSGPTCPSCEKSIELASLRVQLEVQIRECIAKYYEAWTVCSDPICTNRTRMVGLNGWKCLRQECHGKVVFEYSDAQLYNQLRFFDYLFSAEKAMKAAAGTGASEKVKAVLQQNVAFLETMSQTVKKYLDQNGRRWVEMSSLFSFMNN